MPRVSQSAPPRIALPGLESGLASALRLFRQGLIRDVDTMVTSRLRILVPTIAAQKDGTGVGDLRRVLNFQGSGVTVTDDPSGGRVNIAISGSSTAASQATTIDSTTAAKALSLWNGSSNNAPPANWYTTAFNDSGWAAAVAMPGATDKSANLSNATALWASTSAQSATEQVLTRQIFTLPRGTINVATLIFQTDDDNQGVYINGTLIAGTPESVYGTQPSRTFSIPTNLLVDGASNLIAVSGSNGVPGPLAWIAYEIQVTQAISTNGLQLNYQAASDLASSLALTAGAWTDIGTDQSFSVAAQGGTVEIQAGGFIEVLAGASASCVLGSRVVVDSATAPRYFRLGGDHVAAARWGNALSGASPITIAGGLAVGTHTAKIQVYTDQPATADCRCSTLPNQHALGIRVWQRT